MASDGIPNGTVVYGDDAPGTIQSGMPGYYDQGLIYCLPPDGVTPDFNSPNPLGALYIAIATCLLIISTMFVAMRLYTKIFLTRSPGWDDYTSVLSWIGAFIWTGLTIKMVKLGMGRHSWDDNSSIGNQEAYLYITFVASITYFAVICLVKVSILLLYLRAFTESRRFKYIVYVLLFLIVSTHVATIPIYLSGVSPVSCQWKVFVSDEASDSFCHSRLSFDFDDMWYCFLNAWTVLLDLVIVILPCPAVWRLHLAKEQRLAVIAILISGLVATLSSVIRVPYLVHRLFFDELGDNLFTEFQVDMISTVEIETAIICTCLPTLKAFLKRFFPGVLKLPSSNNRPTAFSAGSRLNKRSATNHASLLSAGKSDRKWALMSRDEEALGEDGKSDQSYAMTTVEVLPRSTT